MSCQLREDQCCATALCKAPARFSGYCTRCWLTLTPLERSMRAWEHAPPVDALQLAPDPQAVAPDDGPLSPDETLAMLAAIWAASEP